MIPPKITHEQLRDELDSGLTVKAIAEKYGIHERTVWARKAKLKQTGYDPENLRFHKNPDNHPVKGYSTLVRMKSKDDESPGTVLEWVKTDVDKERQAKAMRAVIDSMKEEIPPSSPVAPPNATTENLLSLYVITDYHLGMMSWHEETGADWDMKLAEDTLVAWMGAAIASSPQSQHAVFANIGDFLHWDGMDAVTPASKHVLDADTRFQKLARVAIRVLRRCIQMLLEKHETVHVLMADANHDPASEAWLREWFDVLYEDEPRVTVDTSAGSYYCHEFGDTSLFFHHGHKRKPANVDHVFAAKFRDVFGRTKHSYAHMGHLHSVDQKETNLMIVEQHRTLAAPDAYAANGGWMSGRDAKVITYHRKHGEVSRLTINFDMLTD